jgi:hypothetical protein
MPTEGRREYMRQYMRQYRQLKKDQNRDELVRKHFGVQIGNVPSPIPTIQRPNSDVEKETTAADRLEKLEPISNTRREPMPLGERISIARMASAAADPDPPRADEKNAELEREVSEAVNSGIRRDYYARIEREKERLKKAPEEQEEG